MKKDKNYELIENQKSDNKETKLTLNTVLLIIIMVILFGLLFKLFETNKYLENICNSIDTGKLNTITEDEDYLAVSKVFEENESEYYSEFVNSENVNEPSSESEEESSEKIDDTSPKKTYIINKNSKKIHYPGCSFTNNMSEENKKVVDLTDEQLKEYMSNGHTMCSRCGG